MFAPDGTSIYSHENFFIKEFMNLDSSKSYVIKSEKDDLTNEIFKDIFWRKLPNYFIFKIELLWPIVWSREFHF